MKSANESKYWLELLRRKVASNSSIVSLLKETEELANILAKSLITMRNK